MKCKHRHTHTVIPMQYWPLWECTCVHTLIHMLVTGLSILTYVAWWRSFYEYTQEIQLRKLIHKVCMR